MRFIYTDKAECTESGDTAANLLPLADKYNLPRLKAICEESICDDIDLGNAVHSLILGHLHEAKNLKAVALEFVSTNLVPKRFYLEILKFTAFTMLKSGIIKTRIFSQ